MSSRDETDEVVAPGSPGALHQVPTPWCPLWLAADPCLVPRLRVEGRMSEMLFDFDRPPYWVPPLEKILALDNGLTAVSTFSGCGGSSLGLHAAGWRIPYAVEFIPAARETYEANFPGTFVDPRDIRLIQPEEILDRLGLMPGELDLYEGSPPCSSFSVAAMRNGENAKFGQMKVKDYSEGVKQATDDLFDHWVRILVGLRPRAFLAENVPGLLLDDAQAFYRGLMRSLADLGYWVDGAIYNTCHFGAATSRRRLILRGIRRDVGPLPARPRRMTLPWSLGDALATLPAPPPADEMQYAVPWKWTKDDELRCIGEEWHNLQVGETSKRYVQLVRCSPAAPLPSITAAGAGNSANPMHWSECRLFTPTELAWAFGYPRDFTLTGKPSQRYERIARSVAPPLYLAHGRVLARALHAADAEKVPA